MFNVVTEDAETEEAAGVDGSVEIAEVELSRVVTESPAVEKAGGDGGSTTSENVGSITNIAASEGDGDDAGAAAVVGESAEIAETRGYGRDRGYSRYGRCC